MKVMLVPSPTPAASPTPSPHTTPPYRLTSEDVARNRKAFYVLTDGKSDAVATALLPHSMVDRLQAKTAAWVVPRADWKFEDFSNMCLSGTPTLRALVFLNTIATQGVDNYLVWSHGWTRLNANALLLSCPALNWAQGPDGKLLARSPELPYLVDVQNGIEGGGYRNGFPFTVAAGLASFFKQDQTTTTTTTTAPATPSPGTTPNPLASSSTTTKTDSVVPDRVLVLATIASSLGSVTVPSVNQIGDYRPPPGMRRTKL